jgi:hypothetical protein
MVADSHLKGFRSQDEGAAGRADTRQEIVVALALLGSILRALGSLPVQITVLFFRPYLISPRAGTVSG